MNARSFILIGLLLVAPRAWADASSGDVSALRQEVQQLTEVVWQLKGMVQAQQQHIADLERAKTAQGSDAARSGQEAPPASLLERTRIRATNLSAFNPEVGVLADIVGQLSERSADGEGNDTLVAREVEVVFGHPIDPYSRLDMTLAFPELENAELEEASITHWGLPEVNTRLGRFKPNVGKAIALHRDSLDTVDEPLVVQRYFGTEGMSKTGVELSGFLPVPWTALTHQLSAGVMQGGVGEGGTLFGETRRRPSCYAHLKNFWDFSDTSNLELGATYLVGSKDADAGYEVNALGLDATVTYHVTPSNKLKWQNEAYLQHRKESVTVETDADTGNVISTTSLPNTPWGFYSLLDYRISPRFGVGGRFDYVEPIDVDQAILARDADTAWSGYVTFYQSEYARWRLQYRHTNFALGGDDNTVFLQGTVAIGVHKHPLQ